MTEKERTPYHNYLIAYAVNGSGRAIDPNDLTELSEEKVLAIALAVEDVCSETPVRSKSEIEKKLKEFLPL